MDRYMSYSVQLDALLVGKVGVRRLAVLQELDKLLRAEGTRRAFA